MQIMHSDAYAVIKEQTIHELNSDALILRHKKSGARLFLLSNDDVNKVFMIGFRTPPKDSTGLPHILEHSVLCGSKKFPAKDPFVELVKGSLNTFLNAMTYPDKTVYPVASCNDKDFQNLMDVYLDAVFNPNIYQNEKIFKQEGWHYELESPESPLTINGVVYNEMKGVFSSPESVLDRYTKAVLFPDNCYFYESGGDPDVIPELSNEEFLAFHQKYYHPSNSYIYLYGNMNVDEKLKWLDEEYLSRYDEIFIDSEIHLQKPFDAPVDKEIEFSITEEESEDNQTYLSINMMTGSNLDKKLYVAFQILEYALLDAPGAPLKQALLDAGIGQDIYGGYENGLLQTYFSVIAKGCEKEQKKEFLTIVDKVLLKIVSEGINRRSLLAGINLYEFKYRESDYGSYPKGLMYGLQCFDSWLYDEADPLMHLEYEETFAFLKENIDNHYFEGLIEKYLLNNLHTAVVTAVPKKGLTAEKEKCLAEKLENYKHSLSKEETEILIRQTKELKAYQEEPTPPEILALIPMLSREDIEKKAEPIIYEEKESEGIKVLHTNLFTGGIGYIQLMFNADGVKEEDLPYLGLLKIVLGSMDTKNFTYLELANEIYIETGGLGTEVSTFGQLDAPQEFSARFDVSVKALYAKMGQAFNLVEEVVLRTDFSNEKRLYELIAQTKSRTKARLVSAGHSTAVLRGNSYFSAPSYFNEQLSGVAFYQFIDDLEKNFAKKKDEVIRRLEALRALIFTETDLIVGFTADDEGYDQFGRAVKPFIRHLPVTKSGKAERNYPLIRKNEGFKTSSGVQYVARCGNFKDSGLAYTGALKILKVLLSYDYLWINIRVKGGAYGCMSNFSRNGTSYFVSYRDPNLKKTDEIYEGIVDYLRNFQADERDMVKYIIGTISSIDVPKNPSAKGNLSMAAYLSGITNEVIQKERDEVINASVSDIRALADICQAVLGGHNICVVGNDRTIEKNREMFNEVKNLFE